MFITEYATHLHLTSEYSGNAFLRVRGDRGIGLFSIQILSALACYSSRKTLANAC